MIIVAAPYRYPDRPVSNPQRAMLHRHGIYLRSGPFSRLMHPEYPGDHQWVSTRGRKARSISPFHITMRVPLIFDQDDYPPWPRS